MGKIGNQGNTLGSLFKYINTQNLSKHAKQTKSGVKQSKKKT